LLAAFFTTSSVPLLTFLPGLEALLAVLAFDACPFTIITDVFVPDKDNKKDDALLVRNSISSNKDDFLRTDLLLLR
jgi:hypothetical protein